VTVADELHDRRDTGHGGNRLASQLDAIFGEVESIISCSL